ncbi:MAG: hypothetical protein PHQ04_03815 [Opitutaceae bacterium]|nr:hypothetical protein [Opitutaceae bacterium]
MKAPLFLLTMSLLPVFSLAQSTSGSRTAGETPPVQTAPPRSDEGRGVDNQRFYAPSGTLIAPEQAEAVIGRFKAVYEKLGKPRLLLYVNRQLVDDSSGLKLTKRTERVEAVRTEAKSDREYPTAATVAPQTQVNVNLGGTGGAAASDAFGRGASESKTEKINAENTYDARDAKPAPLADRQTVRDIERLFGRPLRLGGASLTDQKVAAELIADKPLSQFMVADNDRARKDREALTRIADAVVEILVSARQLTVPEVSGDKTYTAPDISATVIRLSDSAILGQASARDVLGRDRDAGHLVRQFDINDIAEATALALMEDMTLGSK